MRPGALRRAEQKMACLLRIARARLGELQRFLLVNCVETYLQLGPQELAEYAALRDREENREVHVMEMTWAEQLETRGRERGLREGLEGVRSLLLQLLDQKFGPLPQRIRQRVESLSPVDRLTRLAERALVARTLDELDFE